MTTRPGELSVVTGYTHSGKSGISRRPVRQHGAAARLELAGSAASRTSPSEHIPKLLEKYLGAPFRDGPARRMGRDAGLGGAGGAGSKITSC